MSDLNCRRCNFDLVLTQNSGRFSDRKDVQDADYDDLVGTVILLKILVLNSPQTKNTKRTDFANLKCLTSFRDSFTSSVTFC